MKALTPQAPLEKTTHPAAPTINHSPAASVYSPARILLAEDNIVNQHVARRILQKAGHSVVVAGNGLEALAALRLQTFDLVLMDIQMPEVDGFEATAAIRNIERGTNAHLPIIAMTAHAMKGDRERCLAAGMDGYLSKPVRSSDLLALITDYSSRMVHDESPVGLATLAG